MAHLYRTAGRGSAIEEYGPGGTKPGRFVRMTMATEAKKRELRENPPSPQKATMVAPITRRALGSPASQMAASRRAEEAKLKKLRASRGY